MATAYIALGSNLGDRLGYLRSAVGGLAAAPGVQVSETSGVFETEAVADDPQPRYLNAVVRVETDLPAAELLGICLEVERRLGRIRPPGTERAPRTIDLDLLLLGDEVLDQPGLRLPHPGLGDRPFVRVPLAEVARPGLRHPVTGQALDHAEPHPDVRPTGFKLS